MANKDLRRKPYDIDIETWWYEEIVGIEIYHREKQEPAPHHFTIPWRTIRAALKRKDK